MKLKLICCEVFMRPVCMAIANSPHIIDPEFTRLGSHEAPGLLNEDLQKRIDAVGPDSGYDAVLLGYGLCGNSTAGVRAREIPLVIPRAHDCCTIFMGSKAAFLEQFGERLSSQWSTPGYMERNNDYLRSTDTGKLLGLNKDYGELVENYGEENASFIWETLHPKQEMGDMLFIRMKELDHLGHLDRLREFAAAQDRQVQVLEGDMRLINAMMDGRWDEEEFLIVPPGRAVRAVYDHDRIIEIE